MRGIFANQIQRNKPARIFNQQRTGNVVRALPEDDCFNFLRYGSIYDPLQVGVIIPGLWAYRQEVSCDLTKGLDG